MACHAQQKQKEIPGVLVEWVWSVSRASFPHNILETTLRKVPRQQPSKPI